MTAGEELVHGEERKRRGNRDDMAHGVRGPTWLVMRVR